MALLKLIPIGRAYASEQDALDAVETLKGQNFEQEDISVITPSMIEASNPWMLTKDTKDGIDSTEMLAQVVIGVHEASRIPDSHAMVYADSLQQGNVLLIMTAPFGEALLATDTLDGTNTVHLDEMPELEYFTWVQPAPLSALLNLPLLSDRKSWMAHTFGELTADDYRPTEGMFGGLLRDNPTPLSSKFGMDVLSDNTTPLSSRFGWDLLKEDPTPLSNKIGMNTLSDKQPGKKSTSFGVPILSDNPTPLSSALGIQVLKDD